ncbi:hypothetical protein PHYPO_G00173810 [Pangasianodon hypophthalmus]|uniref:Uncharacterized protein n=1 Tax=Pangasianodon hypophthalmus TaxID=310915 RepID=A0A5N5JJH7_PANHP|nr:hypothetical protein PHYPO_G00173810 [Pangasianodon hypophthalmus]
MLSVLLRHFFPLPRPEVTFNLAQCNRRAKFQSTSWEEIAKQARSEQRERHNVQVCSKLAADLGMKTI